MRGVRLPARGSHDAGDGGPARTAQQDQHPRLLRIRSRPVTADYRVGRRLRADFCGRPRLRGSPSLARGHAETPLQRGGATTRRHHPNPAEAQGRWRGRGASRSGSGHHACSVRATSRAQNDARRGIIFFAATEVRILPARHVEQPCCHSASTYVRATPGENPCRSCTLVTSQLEREPSLLRHFGQIGGNSPRNTGGF
jgi:hypothetical protein